MDWFKSKILAKLFLTTTDWNAAWKEEDASLYNVIDNPKGYWLADSLLFENEKGKFLFVEAFEKKTGLGRIGVLEFNGVEFTNFRVVLEQPYHLSYPYVFEYNNKCYMIPESSAHRTVELYQAVDFPTKWEKVGSLLNGNYVDTSLYPLNGSKFYIYTYNMDNYVLVSAVLDMHDKSVNIISELQDPDYLKRAGGNIFEKGNHKYRALQNNTFFYGQSLTIVDCETCGTYETIRPEEINCKSGKRFRRVHTYSRINGYEAIDLSDYRFNVFKVIEKLGKN